MPCTRGIFNCLPPVLIYTDFQQEKSLGNPKIINALKREISIQIQTSSQMNPLHILHEKIQTYSEMVHAKYGLSWHFILLFLFLVAVLFFSFIIPFVDFGRFLGTDDYSHLFHTQKMEISSGITNFYEVMGTLVSNPSSDENGYNYPFGVWLLGATIAKITGLSVVNGIFLFVILFLIIIIGSFYLYSGVFLESREQKILAVLFMVSMPNVAFLLLAYRPSVFILPFLFILLYITFNEPFQWRLLPFAWLSIFIIVISHTGTYIFLISFLVLFYLLYCLLWGRVSSQVYLMILSTFFIYVFSLTWFPQIANQYNVKSTLFLSPGDFFANKFKFDLPSQMGDLFYQNVMVNHELAYVIVIVAFIFFLGKMFRYIHWKIVDQISRDERVYAITLPISNITHSVVATPIWAGPLHVILSCIGCFRLDSKGRCTLVCLLLVTVLPDMLFFTNSGGTGAGREISFLILIIPITAAIGFCQIISYLKTHHPEKRSFSFMIWSILLLAFIITPMIITSYYLPKIAGDDYVIEGMQWLSGHGELSEKVVGLGYRTVPIYTNMTDAIYGVQSGYDTRTFVKLLRGIFYTRGGTNVNDLRQIYGVKYIMSSEKIIANLGDLNETPQIDNNTALNKIYSSKDYGIYDINQLSNPGSMKKILANNITIENTGSSIKIESDVYKVILNGNNPALQQIGSSRSNYLGEGFLEDSIQISGLRQPPYVNPFNPVSEIPEMNSSTDDFILSNLSMVPELQDNQIIYKTVLTDSQNGNNEASLVVRYTFYPTTIKREFLIANDWVNSSDSPTMDTVFSTTLFMPLNDFIIKNNQSYLTRHIYPSQDNVRVNGNIEDLYLYNQDEGIYIKFDPTAPYPSSATYRGSTIYNMSGIGFSQSDSLKPGAILHITQFLSPGNKITAEKNSLTQEGIRILDYPDGIVPIMLAGYRTPYTDIGSADAIENGYRILRNDSVPYTEVVVPQEVRITSVLVNNTTMSVSPSTENIWATNTTTMTMDLSSIFSRNIRIIGSGGTTNFRIYNNYSTQADDISSIVKKAGEDDVPLIGFMPEALNYNLDTLDIVSEKNFSLMLSTPVSPPYYGIMGTETRTPQTAFYHGVPTGVVLLPVSLPMSSGLTDQTSSSEVLSAWKATIDEAQTRDEMVLFIIRSADIGNPLYTDAVESLIEYSRSRGLTFTTPDAIADHFRKIQNIQYSGAIEGDTARIKLTNNNGVPVSGVAFRVVLPALQSGGYNVTNGNIVRMTNDNDNVVLYVSTDIPAYQNKEVTVRPAEPEKKIAVIMPRSPVEGETKISIRDSKGDPLTRAEVIIDTNYYFPDSKGDVIVNLDRGTHSVQVQNPGFETYKSTVEIYGRYYALEHLLG